MDIMVVGETIGQDGLPFSGTHHWLLKKSMSEIGIRIDDCHLTAVFKEPLDLFSVCGPKPAGIPGMPTLIKNKYMPAQYAHHLYSFYKEVNRVNPNLIIAAGSTAAWALCGSAGIKAIRGASMAAVQSALTPVGCGYDRQFQVLPTYHPSTILKDWSLRPVFLSDLDKARRYSTNPLVRRPERIIWIEPTLADLQIFEDNFILHSDRLSIDIETANEQITCIGFAVGPSVAIVIPFFSRARKNYWRTQADEMAAWSYVRRWCQMKPSVFQNGMYDMNWLWRRYGIPCIGAAHDTMLLHHALQPEMQKGLGFLGSLYTDEASWKFMRKSAKTEE